MNDLRDMLPFPAADAHKFSRGKLNLIVGSSGFPGAACLAARAAMKMGAGYCEVFTAPSVVPLVQACQPSLVVRQRSAFLSAQPKKSTKKAPCAYLIGCGFNANRPKRVIDAIIHAMSAAAPLVIDGGALTILANDPGLRVALAVRSDRNRETVLTPHGGEAAKLATAYGLDPKAEPAVLAQELARVTGCVVALKGAVTFISDGGEAVAMDWGTPALAKAGTGDVLAGMIGALAAQRVAPLDAAWLGTSLHALAGAVAAETLTEICVCAEDVIDAIPEAITRLHDSESD